jgi:hypothetical protein
MDDDVLVAAFHAHKVDQPKFTRRMAITIALLLDERPKAVVQRLEALGLLRKGSWAWFAKNGGITAEHIEEVKATNGEN